MNCVILQPSYIPWRGYFEQISKADVFVFYDDVEYDKHGWRNRNRIKGPNGSQWLTIPVFSKGSKTNQRPINEIAIRQDAQWNVKHYESLRQSYSRTPYYKYYTPLLREIYTRPSDSLAEFTINSTILLARELGISHTQFVRSSTLDVTGRKTDRLVSVLEAVGGTHYISGPSAKSYLEEDKLYNAGITIEYMNYSYPSYIQPHPPYDPQVSILDLLFCVGSRARYYLSSQHCIHAELAEVA